LEALTKNCGKIFHVQIAQKDFLKELRGVISPKNSPPVAIQEQVLGMIQVINSDFGIDLFDAFSLDVGSSFSW
jgi:hypothetical protein